MQKRLDAFGILVIAFVTALGGGTLRDIILGDLPVPWLRDKETTIIIFISTVVAILFQKKYNNP